MARRVRFSLAQPITIGGWYISAIYRISLSATAAGPLLKAINFPKKELIWSQAFYYGVWAAILYFFDASLIALTFWGASSGHYGKDFMLTFSERTLMLQTIMFQLYLLIGAYIFSKVEDWNYLDAIYWADVTFFIVGFGDYAPTTTLRRALLIPYALFGIISLGLVINLVRSLILEHGGHRFQARREEKMRRKMVQTITRRGEDNILKPIREESKISRTKPDKILTTEFKRHRAEFALMRKIQAQASFRSR
ncbi:related to potassium channel [Fusarium torulosum]|uniref:Related to potassium channel n=1 Tax=Fusarium torulosum TaxID=33205 RepID=A0AAE8MMA2_9HYPO|nr:related to potassium channel [Fusarium torulosum]